MTLRTLATADVAAVVALQQECDAAPQWSAAVWRDVAVEVATEAGDALHARHAFVAEEGLCTAGFVVVARTLDECEIETLAVAAAFRRRGLGRSLLLHALRTATQAGARHARLEVRASNVAGLSLYRSAGFEQDGRRKAYYRGPDEDAVLLRARLPLLPGDGAKV